LKSDDERLACLRLIRSENVGPVTFYSLLKYFGSAKEALLHVGDFSKRGGRKKEIKPCSEKEAEKEWSETEKLGGKIIVFSDDDYPKLLKTLSDCPPVLSVMGDVSLLSAKSVAIVGTRDASINGRNMARKLAFEAASNGFVVVSGMALGIDAAAHEGAIAATLEKEDASSTVAVLGCGIDTIYPASNKGLYDKIKQVGLLVSDYPLASPLNPANFPRRNRIISGLTAGTVVVEARMKSGSLITASLAAEQGRSVMAVPGSPLDARCQGANWLLQNGAALIQTPSDMLGVLRAEVPLLRDFTASVEYEVNDEFVSEDITEDVLSEARKTVLNLLGNGSVEIDELIRTSGCSASLVNIVLVELELAGRLERIGGARVSLLEETESWT